eukprot:jgi/Hompol1/1921/HPOL_002842-RA
MTATVRFVGTIENKDGEWVGLEWDDVSRGRHSGEYKGRSYFTTSVPGAGTFISMPKFAAVVAAAEAAAKGGINSMLGCSFVEALVDKYAAAQPSDGAIALGGQVAGSGSGSGAKSVTVETVGWDKMQAKLRNLALLRELGLAGTAIATAYPRSALPSSASEQDAQQDTLSLSSIAALCPAVVDLDLSRNLLPSWHEVARIVAEMPALVSLRLAGNRLAIPGRSFAASDAVQDPSQVSDQDIQALNGELTAAFCRIARLAITSCLLTWRDIETIQSWFSTLEELHVGFNGISHLAPVMDAPLSFVSGFDHLSTLNLENNALASWAEDLRLNRNPITSKVDRSNVFYVFVGRIGHISRFNGSPISPRDRSNSELFYLSECSVARVTTHTDPAHFAADHPRYAQLCAIHGEPDAVPVGVVSNALKDRLVKIVAVHPESQRSLEKRLPLTMSVRAAKAMLGRLFGAKVAGGAVGSIELTFVSADGALTRPLDDLRDLSHYDLVDGDQLHVTIA